MEYTEINSEETFGTLKAENKELREALELFWVGSGEVDDYIESNTHLDCMEDTPTWFRIREICHKYRIKGGYVFRGHRH